MTFLEKCGATLAVSTGGALILIVVAWHSWTRRTPEQLASLLSGGPTYELVDLRNRSIAFGSRMLEPLRKASNDFKDIYIGHEIYIAEILAADHSPECRQLLDGLVHRQEFAARLIGAFALAAQGQQLDADTKAFLIRAARADRSDEEPTRAETGDAAEDRLENQLWVYRSLAMRALAETHDKAAVPVLVGALKNNDMPHIQVHACVALARLGDKAGIPPLRDALVDRAFEPTRDAFAALMALGDRSSIGLAIERIDPAEEKYTGGWLVPELRKATGVRLGPDREAWRAWWQALPQDQQR